METLTVDDSSCLIFLVRHGATDANLAIPYILQGCTMDLPLSPTGVSQLKKTSKHLARFSIDAVFSSYLLRARESARIIAEPHKLSPLVWEGIHEVDVGEWEGLSWDKIAFRDPEYHARYVINTTHTPYKGGESYSDVAVRVLPSIEKIGRENRSRRIVVVAHNIVNRVVLAGVMGLQLENSKDLKQNNGCVNILKWTAEGLKLITMNEISHLEEE